MKKAIQYLLISFLVLAVTSCTSDDEINEEQLLRTLIEVNVDGTSETTHLTYDGTKILSIVSPTKNETFEYTGELITRINSMDIPNQELTIFDYIYTNGELTKVICSENYVLNFVHNADGTVSYEKITLDTNNNEVLVYHGTLYFQGQNALEDKRVLDNTVSNEVHKQEVSFVYDVKTNPLNSITGYSKLLDHFTTISANNVASNIEIYSVNYLDTEQATSSAIQYARNYQYDNNGYPTEILSPYPVFGPRNDNHLKSLYFYE
ncbi:hypothetical protein [Flavobacterium terrisoli]|uniref:hypothetical protein n=1 Tax=Flavobacterium terrisoli TaxID=3242195 RepID=UPI002542EE7B|nr:hypothetical protein [Flavobacterium buctense]